MFALILYFIMYVIMMASLHVTLLLNDFFRLNDFAYWCLSGLMEIKICHKLFTSIIRDHWDALTSTYQCLYAHHQTSENNAATQK